MEIKGKIISVMPAESGVSQRGSSWVKQTFVLETEGQYPKKVPFEVFGEERIKNFNISVGDKLTVFIDIDGNEYNNRWYPRISCYRVIHEESKQDIPERTAAPLDTKGEESEDAPF